MFFHHALHLYIWRSLVKQEQKQALQTKIKQAATSLETVLILLEKIKMKKLGYAAPELTAPAQMVLSWPVAKRHSTVCSTVGFANSKRKQER